VKRQWVEAFVGAVLDGAAREIVARVSGEIAEIKLPKMPKHIGDQVFGTAVSVDGRSVGVLVYYQ
jgi:hypothetical protein